MGGICEFFAFLSAAWYSIDGVDKKTFEIVGMEKKHKPLIVFVYDKFDIFNKTHDNMGYLPSV